MADLTVRTYDPAKVVVAFGPILVTGWAEGTMINITRSGDVFEKVKGADGGVDRINKNARDFSVTLNIKQTSPTNDQLSLLMETDVATNGGIVPLIIKDLGGTTLFMAPQAWIGKDPDDELGGDFSNREWRIDTGVGSKFTGGN